jgi:transposase
MNTRELKAQAIVAGNKITRGPGCYLVPGSTGARYRVVLEGLFPHCTCADFETNRRECKHMIAAREWEKQSGATYREFINPCKVPTPTQPSGKQDWPNYNKAQTTEKDWVQTLLADLCGLIPEPPKQPRRGRPSIPLADGVFAACFKVYSGYSARRFTCDLEAARERGFIGRPLHFNSVLNFLENPAVTPILTDLIAKSALPLRSVESQFAVDSSGFATSRFTRYFDIKYGVAREKADFVKAHICVGTKTNVITAAEILDQDAADSPQLPKLVKDTAAKFDVREVSADMAYCGTPNFEAVDALGAVLYSPFKRNATGAAGGLFEKAFHYFNLHRDEFLAHYHRRSNVESTFSMVKAKFGDSVKSKTDTAMKNEVFAKFVCHNLCCLVSAIYELGINPVFSDRVDCTINEPCAQIIRFPGV